MHSSRVAVKIQWIMYVEVPCRLHIAVLQKGTEECSFSHHPSESALPVCLLTARDNMAASENLHVSVGDGSRGSKPRSKPNTRQWSVSVFMNLSVVRTHSAP